MFDRIRIKEMAKTAVRRSYWMVVLVAVLVGLLGGNLAGGLTQGQGVSLNVNNALSVNTDTDMDYEQYDHDDYSDGMWGQPANPWEQHGDIGNQPGGNVWDDPTYEENYSWSDVWAGFKAEWNDMIKEFSREVGLGGHMGVSIFVGIVIVIASIIALFFTLFTVFVGNVMTVGGHGWMLRHWRGEDVSAGEAFAGFRIYKPSVVTMLVRSIYIWLWSLLLVIPGIVKGYAYSMTPYIIYENPNLSADRAIKMSKIMTHGYKWDLFVLNLSFIGWNILSGITGGVVGIFWVNPYMGLTHAGAYEDLKWKAIQSGKLTWEDFGQMPPPPADPFVDNWGNPAPQQSWGSPDPQQFWGNPAPQQPQQPVWGAPPPAPPQQPETWNNPTDTRW